MYLQFYNFNISHSDFGMTIMIKMNDGNVYNELNDYVIKNKYSKGTSI